MTSGDAEGEGGRSGRRRRRFVAGLCGFKFGRGCGGGDGLRNRPGGRRIMSRRVGEGRARARFGLLTRLGEEGNARNVEQGKYHSIFPHFEASMDVFNDVIK
jgi:hypothetical protein